MRKRCNRRRLDDGPNLVVAVVEMELEELFILGVVDLTRVVDLADLFNQVWIT